MSSDNVPKMAAYSCYGLGGLIGAAGLLIAVGGGDLRGLGVSGFGLGIAGVGLGIRKLVGVFERASSLDAREAERGQAQLRKFGAWSFFFAGCLFAAIGLLIVFRSHEPSGLWAVGFGIVFAAAGLVVRKVFGGTDDPGVEVTEREVRVLETRTGRRTRRYSQRVAVGPDANDAGREAARSVRTREQPQAPADEASGQLVDEDARLGSLPLWAAVLWVVLAIVLAVAGVLTEETIFYFGAALVGVAAVARVVLVVRAGIRQRRFGPSRLVLAEKPLVLGGRLRGEILAGLARHGGVRFRLVLECVHRWEERESLRNTSPTRLHLDVLWRSEAQSAGQGREPDGRIAIPVDFEIPADQPAATLGHTDEGVFWTLEVSAPLPGIDYKASFRLPIQS